MVAPLPRVQPMVAPSPPVVAEPIKFIGDLPPITIALGQKDRLITELRNTFNAIDKGDPETKRLVAFGKSGYPLNYHIVRRDANNEDIMAIMNYDQNRIGDAISSFYGRFTGTKDETIAMYWWGMIYRDLEIRPNAEPIHQLTNEELISIVPEDWPYPRDRASIIFKLLSGYNPPRADANKEPRYASIVNTDPLIIARLARYVYNYFGIKEHGGYEFYSQYTPYRHVALQEPSILESFILQYNTNLIDQLSRSMGMKIPPNIHNKEKYYFENLKYYEKVLRRDPTRLVPVPDLEHVPVNNISTLLQIYTDEELLDGYELTNRFQRSYFYTGRKNLIDKIAHDSSRTNNSWEFRKNNCLNSARDNIFELEPREDSGGDPMISYGTMKNYRCWNRDELEGVWIEQDGVFNFAVPDWREGDPYKTFPTASIRELRVLLEGTRDPTFSQLIRQIGEGIQAIANAGARIRSFRNRYQSLTPKQQALVKEYLSWMFLMSMYMRFWKGPGNSYPEVWREGGRGDELCTLDQRGTNVTNQFTVRTQILERMGNDLEQWVLSFPRIEYSFTEGTVAIGAEPINFIVEETQRGNFCLAEGSDHLVQTSYYLLTRILNTNLSGFNQVINDYLGRPDQRNFNPLAVTKTGHTDPQHVLRRLE